MRAVEIREFGGPEVLQPCERTQPQIQNDEVLIKVVAAGVNRPDVMQRKGLYAPMPGVTDIPGLEVAGVIHQVGDHVSGFKVGDKVCALLPGGGYAEYAATPAGQVLPIPDGLSFTEAAAIPETFFTVWHNLFQRAHLKTGETLLIHGGSSGIGTTAIQIAKAFGVKSVVTVGTLEKAEACLALGADHALNYKTQTFEDEVKTLTKGKGVDVILDMMAGSYTPRNLKCLAVDGRIAIIALQAGVTSEVNLGRMLMKRQSIGASTLRPQSNESKASIASELLQNIWPYLASGEIKPVIDQVFPLENAEQAHERMETSQHIGKLVLEV
ncbi:MAG: NAD(P)H-quinone oxidoreductase [Alphaproteobacteria bacterium]